MFRAIAVLGAFSLCGWAASDPVREVTSQAMRVGHQLVPAFYNGYIYWIGRDGGDGAVTIYAPDGHLALAFVTDHGPAEGIAVDTDGTGAVAWWARHKGGGIDLRDRYGVLIRTIQTGTYLPSHVAFGDEHTLWSFGFQVDATDDSVPDKKDYRTVRKYSSDGKLAGAYLPRSLFPAGMEPGEHSWQNSSSIVVAHDRVGLWAYSGASGDETEWVELDLSGNLLGRWRLDQFARGTKVALTTDGHVFVQTRDAKFPNDRLYTLERASATWQALSDPPPGEMQGADGDTLAFSEWGSGPMLVRWYRHP